MQKAQFKRGATSIYVVIVVMLLLTVITASFIRIIVSEANKTTNDDLAQSAYDSALAGVEDAKIALKKYYDCTVDAEKAESEECAPIVTAFNTGLGAADVTDTASPSYGYCDVVADALGRVDPDAAIKEVLIRESDETAREGYEYITQAYTCVMIDNTLGDYRSTLNSSTPIRVIPLKTANPANITGLRISWYTSEDGDFRNLNFGNKEYFKPYGYPLATPPTISARFIQTAPDFTLQQLVSSHGESNSDTGTVFLVPTDETSGINHIQSSVLALSDDHSTTNYPQKVKCDKDSGNEFACSVSMALPKAIGDNANRNDATFYLILDLPYDQPQTTFSVQLCQDSAGTCEGDDAVADFIDAQIAIDATGRANDMYSRIEARIEFSDIYYPFPRYALEATGSDDDAISKNFYVTSDCIRWNTAGEIVGSCPDSDEEPTKL